MKLRLLIALPLAACFVGTTMQLPDILPPIPKNSGTDCNYHWALSTYLTAYAYSAENKISALKLVKAASAEVALCEGNSSILQERIHRFFKREFP